MGRGSNSIWQHSACLALAGCAFRMRWTECVNTTRCRCHPLLPWLIYKLKRAVVDCKTNWYSRTTCCRKLVLLCIQFTCVSSPILPLLLCCLLSMGADKSLDSLSTTLGFPDKFLISGCGIVLPAAEQLAFSLPRWILLSKLFVFRKPCCNCGPVYISKRKMQNFCKSFAWYIKCSRQINRITQIDCKSRDESNRL